MGGGPEPTRDGSWLDWGESGPTLHFAHANGLPPGTYRQLIDVLRSHYHVVSMEARPLWPGSDPCSLQDWSLFVDDLRAELRRRNLRGIVGVGHSLGAVATLLAASRDPGLFTTIVAIDPIVLAGWFSVFWGTMKAVGLGRHVPIVQGARKRRDHWPDLDTVRRSYARKRAFRGWAPGVLDDYLSSGLVPAADGGVQLRYPKRWEARIFRVAPHDLWPDLGRLAVPSLFVHGEHTDTFLPAAARRVAREVPGATVTVISGAGHFVPMEQPELLGRTVLEYLAKVGS